MSRPTDIAQRLAYVPERIVSWIRDPEFHVLLLFVVPVVVALVILKLA